MAAEDRTVTSSNTHAQDTNRDDVQFAIVGSGRELEEVRSLQRPLNWTKLAMFTGRVDDATLIAILSTADARGNPDRPSSMNDKSTMHKIMDSLIHKLIQPVFLDSGEGSPP